MRTIKFRAWDTERKQWHYFVIKPTKENKDTTISFGSPIYNDLKKQLENWGQYTGLKDSKGVEIYEGDILQSEYVRSTGTKVIKYNIDHNFSGFGFIENLDTSKVIGNIYENKNLLTN